MEVLITKFADDTKGQKEIKSEDDKRKMQQALDTLLRWAKNGVCSSTWIRPNYACPQEQSSI
jgi:hypothetical protein